ncbi:N-terminal EF-hand calcium-binding protein 1-like [Acipenser ruthenus]|uniref:N-terminal EF-hand calcium-binding protein 1-like n=1 Tax=Acipenser ruthenus TaxID=7906 RepID=UPI0027417732|nr:N-terminal EF-hand calcium-binding protein 1-like [Acipenser ruthenus]
MMACTEMITMCLQSAKQQHLHAKQQQQLLQKNPPRQGLSILHDIFRRADKNDDGKLSFEEFKMYFSDGILSSEELRELFYTIDRRHTNNLDTEKLCDYFSEHLGEYLDVLSALEKLNIAILKALDKTKEEYQSSSQLSQFVTRFLLRETSSQLQSLQGSLECAMEAVEEQSCKGRMDMKKPEALSVQRTGRRCGRRTQKNMCLSPTDPYSGMLTSGICVEPDNHWASQISRLQQLIDKLECKSPKLEPLKEDTIAGPYKANILLVQRQMPVMEEMLEEFRQALKCYTDNTASQSCSLHVSVQKLPEESCFIMYEFWQDRNSWTSYLQSNASKMFQRSVIDFLESPELVTTMLLPASWWIMNNN